MNFSMAQSELIRTRQQRNGLMILTFILMVGLMLNGLGWRYALQHRQTIILPVGYHKHFIYSEKSISKNYLEALATYFVNMRFNVTPASILRHHKGILMHIKPKGYDLVAQDLMKERRFYKSEQVSSDYKIESVTVDPKRLTVRFKGVLSLLAMNRVTNTKPLGIEIQFSNVRGDFKILTFRRVVG